MKSFITVAFATLALSNPLSVFAQNGDDDDASTTIPREYNPIPSSVQMLNIAPEARGTSMGDAGVASTPDINRSEEHTSELQSQR